MNIEFTKNAWEDFEYWTHTDTELSKKIVVLIKSIKQNPFKGMGKPDPLKFGMKGFWSRRINQEHRLVYKVQGKKGLDQKCIILQCRFHYNKH